MKNNYLFKNLINKETISAFEKNDVFLWILNVINTGNLLLSTTPFLTEENYYIAHNLVSYWGKRNDTKRENV